MRGERNGPRGVRDEGDDDEDDESEDGLEGQREAPLSTAVDDCEVGSGKNSQIRCSDCGRGEETTTYRRIRTRARTRGSIPRHRRRGPSTQRSRAT